MKLFKNIIRFMCYGTLSLGAITISIAMGQFLLTIVGKSLLAVMGYLTATAALILCFIAIGICSSALIEMLFGDPNSKISKALDKLIGDDHMSL